MNDPLANLIKQMELLYLLDTEPQLVNGTVTFVWTNLDAKVAYDYMAEEMRRYRVNELMFLHPSIRLEIHGV